MKKAALTYLATRTTDDDVTEEMKVFFSIDKNRDGYITLKELKEGCKDWENLEEIAEILKGVDIDNNGAINYTEFIAATLDQTRYLAEKKRITDAFNVFDKDGDGVIDEEEMKHALKWENKEGKQYIHSFYLFEELLFELEILTVLFKSVLNLK